MMIWSENSAPPSALSAEPSFDLASRESLKQAFHSSPEFSETVLTPAERQQRRSKSPSSTRPLRLPRGVGSGTSVTSNEGNMRSPADSFAFSDISKSVSFMVSLGSPHFSLAFGPQSQPRLSIRTLRGGVNP